jgi:hypothetical protein
MSPSFPPILLDPTSSPLHHDSRPTPPSLTPRPFFASVVRSQDSPLRTHHHDSPSPPYLSYLDRHCPHYPLSPGDETHTFLSCPILQPHFVHHFVSLDSLLIVHGLYTHLTTLTPRQRLSLLFSSDPFPLLSGKSRTLGTGIPKDRDEVNRREVSECDG